MKARLHHTRGAFTLTSELTDGHLAQATALVRATYWGASLAPATIRHSFEQAFCVGVFDADHLIGFSRVVTDYARFAYLSDVVIQPSYQGQGLGSWMLDALLQHAAFEGAKWVLFTEDAQAFYTTHGFSEITIPQQFMSRPRWT
ncbi:MAG: GNAT family N-acetyltransferase [Rhodothermales bacterium]